MILNILCFYNLELDCFTQPVYDDHEVEVAAIQLGRSLKAEKDYSKVAPYRNLVMYHIGIFNDETGEIKLVEKRKLIDCAAIVKERPDYVESKNISRN